jgi:cytidyltransferase-like protein
MNIGLVNGVFDLFHAGHRAFLVEAKNWCDQLVIGVNDDSSCRRLKGLRRPFHTLARRERDVRPYADFVVSFSGDVQELIGRCGPNILIRGWDQLWTDPKKPHSVHTQIQLPKFGNVSTTRIANGLEIQPRDAGRVPSDEGC